VSAVSSTCWLLVGAACAHSVLAVLACQRERPWIPPHAWTAPLPFGMTASRSLQLLQGQHCGMSAAVHGAGLHFDLDAGQLCPLCCCTAEQPMSLQSIWVFVC
jgi:hypothetical protein